MAGGRKKKGKVSADDDESKGVVLAEPVLKQADMPPEMRKAAFEIAKQALTECSIEKDQATMIKIHFDTNYSPSSWQCIVGKTYGVSIAHATKFLIFFSIGHVNILLFKSFE